MLYLMLEKYSICFSCSDLKSRNKAPAVRIGGGVEDESLDAGHCVEAGEDKHEGEPKHEHIQLFQLERNTLKRGSATEKKHIAAKYGKRRNAWHKTYNCQKNKNILDKRNTWKEEQTGD